MIIVQVTKGILLDINLSQYLHPLKEQESYGSKIWFF